MRPIRLEMSAFGPYPKREVVDFGELGTNSFFLIHGETGAGKTTILDAMSFALYGKTSGEERTGDQMRSHHADPSNETEVVFDFSIGENAYRISRTPEQERQKKRGMGTTSVQAAATAWTLGPDGPEGLPLASGVREVNDFSVRVLGLTASQFRQVVLLPQGRFRELLSAKSSEREEILQQLFRTDTYREIEQFLKERTRSMEGELADLRSRREAILIEHHAQTADELEERIAELRDELKDIDGCLAASRKSRAEAETQLAAAQKLEDVFVELDEAVSLLDELKKRAPEIDEAKARLEAAKKAERIDSVYERLVETEGDCDEAEAYRATQAEDLEKAEAAFTAAKDSLKAQESKEKDRKQARQHSERLEGMRSVVAAIEEAKAERDEAGEFLEDAMGRLASATEELESAASASAELLSRHEQAKEAAAVLPAKRAEYDKAAQTLKDVEDLKTVDANVRTAKTRVRELTRQTKDSRKELERAKRTYKELEAVWHAGQAGVLARTLEDGGPCPVCGSTEHPHPAEPVRGAPSREELEQLGEAVEIKETALQSDASALAEAETALAVLDDRHGAVRKRLGDELALTPAQANQRVKALKKDLDALEAAASQVKELQTQYEGAERRRKECEALAKKLDQAVNAADRTLGDAQTKVAEREKGVPGNLRSAEALEAEVANAGEALEGLEQAYSAAQQLFADAQMAHSGAKADHDSAKKALASAERKLKTAATAFTKSIEEHGFASLEVYRNARLMGIEVDSLEGSIQRFSEELATTKDRQARAKKTIGSRKRPDVDSLHAKADELSDECERLIGQRAEQDKAIQVAQGGVKRLQEVDVQLSQGNREYSTVANLAEVSGGSNELKLSFHRYVLGAFLDEVLVQASGHLAHMSKGRYRLLRAAGGQDKRRPSGLDLDVFDEQTGKSRSASTLSGGEGFYTSLALALGLADTVQARSGGIQLDTVFVDEGFGTLDQDVLDLAIDTLLGLREGNRLVGIISHVNELQRRIDCRLEVTCGSHGSKTRFVVP